MFTAGARMSVPAIAAGSSCRASFWIMGMPLISSPWIAALTNTQGPGRAPWSTWSARLAARPVSWRLTGMASVRRSPGATVSPAISNGADCIDGWSKRISPASPAAATVRS